MNFHDSAFEKAYLQIIRESAGLEAPSDDCVCPECGGVCVDGVCQDCGATCDCENTDGSIEDGYVDEDGDADECDEDGDADECDEDGDADECDEDGDADECDEDGDADECDEDGDADECDEDGDADECDEDDDAPADDADTEPADDAAPAEGEEDQPEGKFISFFTTDENLIKALQDGFATVAITGTDEKAEPVEFAADLFENLSVEDLKDDENAEGDAEGADAEADATDDEAAEADDAKDDK